MTTGTNLNTHNNELLTAHWRNFKQLGFERTEAHATNIRFKEILKRKALYGKIVGLLTNSCASNPFFVNSNSFAKVQPVTSNQ